MKSPVLHSLTVAAAGALALLVNSGCFLLPVSSDEEMLAFFDGHETQFQELLEKVLKDDVVAVTLRYYTTRESLPDVVDVPGSGLSAHRWEEYRELLKALDITVVKRRLRNATEYGDRVEFVLEVRGVLFAGVTKGIVFAESPPEPLLSSLDRPGRMDQSPVAFKKVKDKWYLFIEKHS